MRCRIRRCLFSVIFLSTFLFLLPLKIIGSGQNHFNFNDKVKVHKKTHKMPSAGLKKVSQADRDKAEQNLTETIQKIQDKNFELTSIYKNRNLKDFQPEFGGHPITNILVSTFRSGSSFLGEVLSQPPGTFYTFEPFSVSKTIFQIYSLQCPVSADPNVTEMIRDMIKCKLDCFQSPNKSTKSPTVTQSELHKIPGDVEVPVPVSYCSLKYQTPVLRLVDPNMEIFCSDRKYREKVCSKFPMQLMKLVEVSLKQVQGILEEDNPNVRILYLVRDPRGTMLSRYKYYEPEPIWRKHWTLPVLCSGLLEDYHVAMTLAKKYPEKFRTVRFESLAKDPWNTTQKIYSFFHLPFGLDVQLFLKTHTEKSIETEKWSKLDRVHSTYRNSTTVPDAWIREAKIKTKPEETEKTDNFEKIVLDVQKECGEAMKLWGYKIVNSVDELNENFSPIEKTDSDYSNAVI